MAMDAAHAFAGNPLIAAKQDKPALPRLLAGMADPAAPCVLPVAGGRVLVWGREGGSADGTYPSWGLAWQSLASLGISVSDREGGAATPPEAPEDAAGRADVASKQLATTDLIYLGELKGQPYFAVEIPSESSRKPPPVDGFTVPHPALHPQWMADTRAADVSVPKSSPSSADTSEASVRLSFGDMRTIFLAVDPEDGQAMAELAIAGQARAMGEWHRQTQFCGTCGSASAPAEGGNRRTCSSPACGAKAYPRIDPVVIMLILDAARDRVVLGRQPKFPPGMWSCLAGFMEVGESMEEAVRREVREEVGLSVSRVLYHSSQPWPVGFGNMQSQLMVGFIAEVSSFDIVVEQQELEDARWFSRQEVIDGLNFGLYAKERNEAVKRLGGAGRRDGANEATEAPSAGPSFYLPGPFAIAHALLKSWAFSPPSAPTAAQSAL